MDTREEIDNQQSVIDFDTLKAASDALMALGNDRDVRLSIPGLHEEYTAFLGSTSDYEIDTWCQYVVVELPSRYDPGTYLFTAKDLFDDNRIVTQGHVRLRNINMLRMAIAQQKPLPKPAMVKTKNAKHNGFFLLDGHHRLIANLIEKGFCIVEYAIADQPIRPLRIFY
jgi:hypothetical protein